MIYPIYYMLFLPSQVEMNSPRPLILLDPYPRAIDLIFDSATKAKLESLGEVIWHDGTPLSDDKIEARLPEVVALIGQSAMPKERLERASKLKAIFNVESNFLPNVDYRECHERGVHVLSTAPVFSKPVAEMILGLALCAARRITQADAAIRSGTETLYGVGDNEDSILLTGRTIGVIGCGNVGRALLPLLRAFGGEIVVHDPWISREDLAALDVTPVSLEECFRRSAVVFILSATTTENAGHIGRKYFESMPKDGIVVLGSRAGVVNFDELLDAAESGRIRAAIDVWPTEPIPADHRARRTPNTVLQAHRAGNIPEIWPWMGQMVVSDLELILKGDAPRHCQRARWETVAKLRSKPAEQV